jgi:hypothetical protein
VTTTINAKVIADSISERGKRLTTLEVTYPRFVHAEFMTHRVFSRNAASSRAIPLRKMIERVSNDPALPVSWPVEQRGMQGGEELSEEQRRSARRDWLQARDYIVEHAELLEATGVHKSVVNRLLEPWAWMTVIVTATEWDGFWEQRCSPLAQPEIRVAAEAMRAVYDASEPSLVRGGGWHLPYIQEKDWGAASRMVDLGHDISPIIKRVSAARCARVSYLTHDGKRDIKTDLDLYDRLVSARPMHACYDDQTEILTEDGFRLLSGVTTDDVVGVWDAEAGTLRYEHPLAVRSYDYNGLMYRVDHPKVDLLVTPNHRMWVSRRTNHGSGGMEWNEPEVVEARDLGDKSMVRYHKVAPLIAAPDVKMDHLPHADDHDALLTLVGFFLGDGHAVRPQNHNPNRISFHLRRTRKVVFLRHLANRLGWPLLEQACDMYSFAVEGVGMAFRESFYNDQGHKILAGTFNRTQALALLDGLRNSDGSEKRNTWVYDTTSEPLRDAIERLLLHAGLSWSRAREGVYGCGMHRLSIHTLTDPVVNQGRRNTSTEQYTGTVWCPTVGTGLVVVRRNGQVVVCGNSPLEHVSTPLLFEGVANIGNFKGWSQFRAEVELNLGVGVFDPSREIGKGFQSNAE